MKSKKKIYNVVFVLLIITCLVSGGILGMRLYQRQYQQNQLTELSETVNITQKKIETPEEAMLRKATTYKQLKDENSDFIGWLSIEGTILDYPVMYTPETPEYYLRRNFDRQYSIYGIPFLDENCSQELTDKNILIYGHYVKNGAMFGNLENYKDKEYFENHRYISFDTIHETEGTTLETELDTDVEKDMIVEFGKYEIVSVFVTQDSKDGFPYYDFVGSNDETTYNEYIKRIKKLSIYETGVVPHYGRQLLTLSTCDYSKKNGRLVIIVARTDNL